VAIIQLTVTIDTSRPLGPQLAAARARGLPWKLLADITCVSERHLRRLVEMSGIWDRQAISLCVLNPPVTSSVDQLGVSSLKTGAASPAAAPLLPGAPVA